MKKKKFLLVVLTLGMFMANQPLAAVASSSAAQQVAPTITGESAIMIDAQSGQVLFAKNPQERLPIASITKIMTAIVALDKKNLDDVVTIQPDILDRNNVYGTLLYLEPGEKFTLRQLLYGMLLNSANDAAAAIADYVGGNQTNFVKMMNDKAKQLGATDTHFVNPHGLSEPGHYSSARDMALFARYAMQNPVFAQIVQTKTMDFPRSDPKLPNKLYNIDHMLWLYDGVDGVKPGYTAEAENTIVTSATRNGRRLLVVILKDPAASTLYKDDRNLLNYGFDHFYDQTLAEAYKPVDSVPVANGQTLKLAPQHSVYGTLPLGQVSDFQLKYESINASLPVKAGDIRGKLNVLENGKIVETVPLVALNSIDPIVPVSKKVQAGLLWYLISFVGALLGIGWFSRSVRSRKLRRIATRSRQYRYYQD